MQTFFAAPRFSRRAVILSALLATASALLAGCGGGGKSGPGDTKNSPTTTITGRVLNSTAGDAPVEGATVVIGGKSAITRTVDTASADTPTGSFVITDAPLQTDIAVVTPPGGGAAQTIRFAPPIAAGTNSPIELVINIGQISGRVLLANGQPASGAFITIAATGESVTAGTNGRFFLRIVPAGQTQVFVVLGTASKTQDVTVGIGNTDVGDITLVDDPNPTPPGIPNTIVGTVTLLDANGTIPAPSTSVVLFRNGIQLETTTTDANGNYGFYVPVGTAYSVLATRAGFQNTQSGTLSVTNPSVPVHADLALPPQ